MIALHRLNGAPLTLNAMHLLLVEATPDTLLTLTTGERMLVREGLDEVVAATRAYHRSLGALAAGTPAPHSNDPPAEE